MPALLGTVRVALGWIATKKSRDQRSKIHTVHERNPDKQARSKLAATSASTNAACLAERAICSGKKRSPLRIRGLKA